MGSAGIIMVIAQSMLSFPYGANGASIILGDGLKREPGSRRDDARSLRSERSA